MPAAGRVYVADNGNHRVQVFSGTGVFLGQWGGLGTGPGQFAAVTGFAVDEQGAIYVVDSGLGCVQKFEQCGRWPEVAGAADARPAGAAAASPVHDADRPLSGARPRRRSLY